MISKLASRTRKKALKKIKPKSPDELSASWIQEDLLYSGKGRALFMILPTIGCSWALSETGGCTMCSYISDSFLEPVDAGEIIEIFDGIISRYELDIYESKNGNIIKIFDGIISRYELEEKTAVKIFTSGSFLNPEEFPQEAVEHILSRLGAMENVEEIIFESRPEYINQEAIARCCELAGDKIVEISIGLETCNEKTRLMKINKGFSNSDFEIAVNTISDLKGDFNVRAKAYILVKPILVSEKRAVEEAISTAIYAEKVGVDRLSFCPSTVHRGTIMEDLWRKGSYRPPWIWSLIEIINRTREKVSVPAIMDTSGFGTSRGPYNCKKCNRDLKNLIIRANLEQTQVPAYECECRSQWLAELKFSETTASTDIKYSEYS
ncbi:TIGR01210 family radical SAM protein [Methanothermobacter sp. KEPCO-1]|uniref:archaeosine biosynthesis radical SAM protein RaSEA n=1 Tax=Methanothermobacter sp. KEPCO-1 TaxID=2603820 RepID=UPI0011CBFE99|nr:archaeosine biosynthesis radical SAM protein RaSEA [Methanothermobacter sp. KEPCO-1]QEF94197.1 TIGR01210 family radical SAM protein [Methanothermobacter sp. KEPCO-1]